MFAYQFLKILDEIKEITIGKFRTSIHHATLYIYRIEDKLRMNCLDDFFERGSLIFGSTA